MKQYRFKTLREFKNVFGEEWRDSLRHWFSPGMDELLGARLSRDENTLVVTCLRNESNGFSLSRDVGTFSISPDMLVEMGTSLGVISTPRAKKYRFKTQKEFEQYGLTDWKSPHHWNHEGRMDYLYGKELTEQENASAGRLFNGSSHSFELDRWTIDSGMLKEITSSSYTTLNENLIKGSKKILLNQNN